MDKTGLKISRRPSYLRTLWKIDFMNYQSESREVVLDHLEHVIGTKAEIVKYKGYWEVTFREIVNKNASPRRTGQRPKTNGIKKPEEVNSLLDLSTGNMVPIRPVLSLRGKLNSIPISNTFILEEDKKSNGERRMKGEKNMNGDARINGEVGEEVIVNGEDIVNGREDMISGQEDMVNGYHRMNGDHSNDMMYKEDSMNGDYQVNGRIGEGFWVDSRHMMNGEDKVSDEVTMDEDYRVSGDHLINGEDSVNRGPSMNGDHRIDRGHWKNREDRVNGDIRMNGDQRMNGHVHDQVKRPVQATDDFEIDGANGISRHMNGMYLNEHNFEAGNRSSGSPIATSVSSYQKETSGVLHNQVLPRDQLTGETPSTNGFGDAQYTQSSTERGRERSDAKYPDYALQRLREETFVSRDGTRRWPHASNIQDTSLLAKHGFFYTGQLDLLRCHHCGLGLKDWSAEDDVLFVHLKYSPNCHHVLQTVDSNRLNVYRRHIQQQTNCASRRNLTEPGFPNTVRHPEYQAYDVRLSSFNGWPRDLPQTPDMLAEAGFFYTGLRDVVRCYACDGGLQRWDAGDQPWIEHARWFPFCTHVINCKGEEYIRLVQAAAEGQNEEELPEEVNNAISAETVYPLYTPAAQSVVALGYSQAAVAMAIDDCKSKGLPLTAENMTNILLDKQENGEELPTDSRTVQEATELTQFNGTSRDALLEERDYLRRRLMCMVCQIRDRNILFLPCGHHKTCAECSRDLVECPVCCKAIQHRVKTYMS